jgi:hypothetical protein
MSLIHTAPIPSFLSALLLAACVAKDPDSLGDLETGDGGTTESAGSTDDGATSDPSGTSASAGSEGSESAGESGEPMDPCPDPALSHYEPSGCPDDLTPILPGAGCYEPCDGSGDACMVGTCTEVQVNPCVCPDGEGCCAACGAIEWLCVEGLPDAICEQIVGTTFSSVEELECGLTPMGPQLCHWTVVFEEDGDYLWQYSDVGQGGTYTCEGGVISVDNDPDLEASYDPVTGILTWDGVEYVAAPA